MPWPVSEAASRWHWAMHRQDVHESACLPCRANSTPVCPEGIHLQDAARRAHEAWVIDEHAGKAVA